MKLENDNPASDLEAQLQHLQSQLHYMKSEMHARIISHYQVVGAMLDILARDRDMIPATDVIALSQQLSVMHLVHSLSMQGAETHLLIRLPVLLQEIQRLFNSRIETVWRLEITGEEIWLTSNQANALGLVLQAWHGVPAQRQGVPFSLEISVGSEKVIIASSSLIQNAALENPQSDTRCFLDILTHSDLLAECTYGRGNEGQMWAALSLPRARFETPESRQSAQI